MQKSFLSFIEDEKDMLDEIGADGKDVSSVVIYTKAILNEIKDLASDANEKNMLDILYSNETNTKIIDKIHQLEISLKHKFMLLTMNMINVPQTESWFIDALKPEEKMTWKEYWIKILEMGEPVADQFLADMFREIYLSLYGAEAEDESVNDIEVDVIKI